MSRYAVVRIAAFDAAREPVRVAPSSWTVAVDLRKRTVTVKARGTTRVLELDQVSAVQISDEKDVASVGRTLGRMALTGVGASLFWKGRRGGLGAGLLDLSARGAVHTTMVSGLIFWPDTTVVEFTLTAPVFEKLLPLLPEGSFEEETIESARATLDLLQRLKEDGDRAVAELAHEMHRLRKTASQMLLAADGGENFAERDRLRQEARQTEAKARQVRFLFLALLAETGLSPQRLAIGR